MAKKPTSIRLDSENEAKLNALAKRDKLPVSQIINRAISEYSGKQLASQQSPEMEKRLNSMEQELSTQRQRINILKNQIDFILKSQNGKGKYDKYPRDNRTKQSLENQQGKLGS